MKNAIKRRPLNHLVYTDCGKVVAREKSDFKMHTRLHTLTCLICKRVFPDLSTYRVHMDSHDSDDFKMHIRMHTLICSICKCVLPDLSIIPVHMDSHKTHKCKECYRRFTRSSSLRTHMAIHANISALKIHFRSHIVERKKNTIEVTAEREEPQQAEEVRM